MKNVTLLIKVLVIIFFSLNLILSVSIIMDKLSGNGSAVLLTNEFADSPLMYFFMTIINISFGVIFCVQKNYKEENFLLIMLGYISAIGTAFFYKSNFINNNPDERFHGMILIITGIFFSLITLFLYISFLVKIGMSKQERVMNW